MKPLLRLLEPDEFNWPVSVVYSWIANVMEPAYVYIAERAALPETTKTLLEIGGGDGRLAVALAERYPTIEMIVTSDISADMARKAGRRAQRLNLGHRIRAEAHDVHRLGFEDESFDAVVSFASLHHWRDKAKGLREVDRVLKPGGVMAVMDGCGRPSFGTVRATVSDLGGSIWTTLAYWIGSKEVLMLPELSGVVEQSGLRYLSMELEGPAAILRGVKPL